MAAAPSRGFKIAGYDVLFPAGKSPFPAQKAVISKTLSALRSRQNALLESPTGTGKTLALLTSTLSYQRADYLARLAEYDARMSEAVFGPRSLPTGPGPGTPNACAVSPLSTRSNLISPASSPMATADKLAEERCKSLPHKQELAGNIPTNSPAPLSASPAPQSPLSLLGKKPPAPPRRRKIFYASRTHSQIKQVTDELKTCPDEYTENIRMSVLGSRQQLCINRPEGSSGTSLDKHCRDLNKGARGCRFRENSDRVAYKMQSTVWDIEDVVAKGRSMRGCPYFATKTALVDADLVFAPYNYLVDPHIRESMRIDLTDCIVVIDEAHNIQDSCRESASMEVGYPVLVSAIEQLKKLRDVSDALASLYSLCNSLNMWFETMLTELHNSNGFKDNTNVYDGEEVMNMFATKCDLNMDTVSVFESFLPAMNEQDVNALLSDSNTNAVSLGFEEDEQEPTLGIEVVFMIKKLLLTYRFLAANTAAYKLVLKCEGFSDRVDRRIRSGATSNNMDMFYTATFNLWCLSATVAFRNMSAGAYSVLLTSGTLSPLDSFASELGALFPVQVETPHVIDHEKQLRVAAIAHAKGETLQGTFSNRDNYNYKDAVGQCVSLVSRVSPGGTLVFFSSYSVMDATLDYWAANKDKMLFLTKDGDVEIFKEPKVSSELDDILDKYREVIDGGRKALMFAVCRGKVSEGIDFANDYARSVIVVGIPFPAKRELKVELKQKYQDELRRIFSGPEDQRPLSGDQWYQQQAYRAVNQAVGRCIRHKNDYGAIILCDKRFQDVRTIEKLSSWLRPSVKLVDSIEEFVQPLNSFFGRNINSQPPRPNNTPAIDSSNGLKVPLMFSTAKGGGKYFVEASVRPVFESMGSANSSSSTPSAARGQLSINASFQRGAQWISTDTVLIGDCCQSKSLRRDSYEHVGDRNVSGESEISDDDSLDTESLASTQDIGVLSPPSPYQAGAQVVDIDYNALLSIDSNLRLATADWELSFWEGSCLRLSASQDLLAAFYSSHRKISDCESSECFVLPVVERLLLDGTLDTIVNMRYFRPLYDKSYKYVYSNGEPILQYGLQISDWNWPPKSRVFSDEDIVDKVVQQPNYSEEWVSDDGVVYGVLRLAVELGGGVLAVKVLAGTPARSTWCGLA